MLKRIESYSPGLVSFASAVGISLYMFLVSLLLSNGNQVFGSVKGFIGPLIFLTLLGVSILICGFLTLAFPFYLFWTKKNLPKALNVLGLTTFWMILFFLLYVASISLR